MTADQLPDDEASASTTGAITTTGGALQAPARSASRAWDNVRHLVTDGHLADTRRMPRLPVLTADGYTVHRYEPTVAPDASLAPLLLVPPLGAPDFAFDLRRGASLVEDLLASGREIYIVTYEASGRAADRRGLELWVDEILPAALYAVSDRHEGTAVHLAGWSLGGLFTLLCAASGVSGAPIRSVTAFASPVDVSAVPLVAPFRSVAEYTGGRIFSTAYRTLGSFPATAVKWAFQLTSVERYLTKPVTLLTHLDDRELLEQIEAVDLLMANMTAYPGRAFGQIYHHVDPLERPRRGRPAPRRPPRPAGRRAGAGAAGRGRRRRHRAGRRRRARDRPAHREPRPALRRAPRRPPRRARGSAGARELVARPRDVPRRPRRA